MNCKVKLKIFPIKEKPNHQVSAGVDQWEILGDRTGSELATPNKHPFKGTISNKHFIHKNNCKSDTVQSGASGCTLISGKPLRKCSRSESHIKKNNFTVYERGKGTQSPFYCKLSKPRPAAQTNGSMTE